MVIDRVSVHASASFESMILVRAIGEVPMRRPLHVVSMTLIVTGIVGCEGDPADEATPVQFVMRVAETSPAVWVDMIGQSSTNGRWISFAPDAGPFPSPNASCACDQCDEYGDCPMYDAPMPNVEELAAGQAVTHDWDGLVAGRTRQCRGGTMTCFEHAVASSGPYTATFCFGTDVDGTPPHEATLVDERCTDVAFEVPFEQDAVELVVYSSE